MLDRLWPVFAVFVEATRACKGNVHASRLRLISMFSSTAHVSLSVVICVVGMVRVGWPVTYVEEMLYKYLSCFSRRRILALTLIVVPL